MHAVFHREGVGPGIPLLTGEVKTILLVASNEDNKMKRMKEEEKENRRGVEGWGVKEGVGGGMRRENVQGWKP